jgi:antitoxin Phd
VKGKNWPLQEWKRRCQLARPSLKALLLMDFARADLKMPPRGRHRRRSIQVRPEVAKRQRP